MSDRSSYCVVQLETADGLTATRRMTFFGPPPMSLYTPLSSSGDFGIGDGKTPPYLGLKTREYGLLTSVRIPTAAESPYDYVVTYRERT